jgi:hypothetical protein
MCSPIKSLRMTVKALLKTEMKKRKAQIAAAEAPAPVVEPTPTPAPAPVEAELTEATPQVDVKDPAIVDDAPAIESAAHEDQNGIQEDSIAQTIEPGDAAQSGDIRSEVCASTHSKPSHH